MTVTLEASPVVVRTLFPVRVLLDGEEVAAYAKLVLTSAAVYAWSAPDGTVREVLAAFRGEAVLAGPWQGRNAESTIALLDGTTLTVVNLGGCGCRSGALRYHWPFPPPMRLS